MSSSRARFSNWAVGAGTRARPATTPGVSANDRCDAANSESEHRAPRVTRRVANQRARQSELVGDLLSDGNRNNLTSGEQHKRVADLVDR